MVGHGVTVLHDNVTYTGKWAVALPDALWVIFGASNMFLLCTLNSNDDIIL